jgi:16S rRNA (uracil1498-N3)-methyltransferase
MNLFYAPNIATDASLPEEESGHAVRVLRMREGEELTVIDGQGHFYRSEITSAHPKHCTVQVLEVTDEPLRPYRVEIAVAPTKNLDRMEWLMEKCVEMGLDRFIPLKCRFSERKELKLERMERIAVSAMKQSLKATLPELSPMTDILPFLREPFEGQKFIAHCYKDSDRLLLSREVKAGSAVRILIGPEGDFSPEEVETALAAGYRPISLGDCRLRTETAALCACHTVHVINSLAPMQ